MAENQTTPADDWAAATAADAAEWRAAEAVPDAGKSTCVRQRRAWSGNLVVAVAECPGWVFVMPAAPSAAGRPFSIAYPVWITLPEAAGAAADAAEWRAAEAHADHPAGACNMIAQPARRGGKSLAAACEVAKALAAGVDVWMAQPGAEAVRIVGVAAEVPQRHEAKP